MTQLKKWIGGALVAPALMFSSLSAYADTNPNAGGSIDEPTIGNFLYNVTGASHDILQMVIAILIVVGIVFIVMGAMKLKQNHDQPNQGHAAKGFITLLVGIILVMPITMTKVLRNTLDNGLVKQQNNSFNLGNEGVYFDKQSATANKGLANPDNLVDD